MAAGAVAVGGCGGSSTDGHVRSVSAITKVFGDGQKLIAVAVEYDREIADSSLSPTTFTIADRTVTKVYANRAAQLVGRGTDGHFVIVELSPDDAAAALWVTQQGSDTGANPSTSVSAPSTTTSSGGVGAGGPKVGDSTPGGTIVAAKASLVQKGAVTTTDGTRYAPTSRTLTTSAVVNLIVDDFKQFTYDDAATGRTLRYNLFIPRNYDSRRRYPLVLFMHDANVVDVATQGPLVQGLGAVCWAGPEDQAKHECFVLAPEYGSVVVDDNYQPSTLFGTTADLVRSLTTQYSIDENRRYTTGQSMGAMMSLGLNIKHPDLFAAAFIVAGQWPSEQAAPLADKKMWIVVSQDDDKSYSGENAITQVIEGQGAEVATAVWDGRSTAAQFAAAVSSLEAQQAPVNFASFGPGTTVTAGSGTSAHMGTWHIAYTIPGIRDWIMQQSK
ncbi:alpha/beta hydrolase-fold protein [Nocardia jiangxiensis]|uniref:Alpha/beta hydrolase-fold protein n=1 Tax=Nocardia jiangxiensis TaxID=282685 RepID=A0ABW6SB72_9NOCA|nr:alpha/beta hydrolase-fold protein [Nocardia jiangxiensis]